MKLLKFVLLKNTYEKSGLHFPMFAKATIFKKYYIEIEYVLKNIINI